MQVEAGYVVEVGLETGRTAKTLLSTIEVVTQHHWQGVGVIRQSEERDRITYPNTSTRNLHKKLKIVDAVPSPSTKI